ncbi:uncharacterized protein [Physeter macrocephalus]|uniref:Uncharacterized protein n=1 Tax=Physeter macrocephalus TaxID=9755 RepID=A0A9W2X188_PHYMC|nr:uncharacterized protein LOC129392639 [Physeter catodon]
MTWFSRAAPSAADPRGRQPPQLRRRRGPYQAHPRRGGQPGERGRRNATSVRSRRRSKAVGRTTREACKGAGEGGARTQLRGAACWPGAVRSAGSTLATPEGHTPHTSTPAGLGPLAPGPGASPDRLPHPASNAGSFVECKLASEILTAWPLPLRRLTPLNRLELPPLRGPDSGFTEKVKNIQLQHPLPRFSNLKLDRGKTEKVKISSFRFENL